ncbi:hypothetical protein VB715_21705 [Crocosphaera sp. UHCC 0190]|uniref:hypothetical protein n=1 Tax=Crocosphaera sp. UHCC 0190 TaxID=3110246 RepID=UPI002B1F9053|nr:hypothetical protein [Crocosphaera sp. UHCC 0190]MEA5512391.1 hypothetical protein [Crocosphaera sp. UHCC 0190]
MIISDLDYWQRFSEQGGVFGGIENSLSNVTLLTNEPGYLLMASYLVTANAIGKDADVHVTGFSMNRILSDGSSQSSSGSASQSSSGNDL